MTKQGATLCNRLQRIEYDQCNVFLRSKPIERNQIDLMKSMDLNVITITLVCYNLQEAVINTCNHNDKDLSN